MLSPGFIRDNPTVNILIWLLLNYSHNLLGVAPPDFSWATLHFISPALPLNRFQQHTAWLLLPPKEVL